MAPVGRPRSEPRTSDADPRDEILSAAAELFAAVGYSAASTRLIAQSVGLRQASLFHYYPRKEAILSALLDQTVRSTLELTKRIEAADLGPEAAMWVLVEADVANLCHGPHNVGALQLLPEARGEQFDWFWKRRARLVAYYRKQIKAGHAAGLFPVGDSNLIVELVFGLVESVITARSSVRADPATPALLAGAALRMLGTPAARVDRAATKAQAFLAADHQATVPA